MVNNSALSLATSVPVLVGINRDELGVFFSTGPSNTSTFTSFLDTVATNTVGTGPPNLVSTLNLTSLSTFPGLPSTIFTAPTPSTILNATIRLTTDWLFACNTFAKAFSASKHAAFGPTYFFEFNRTYSPRGYTQPWCDPPATATHPYGNPSSAEYFKCHAGEQMVVFGTEARAGVPDRDGLDRDFMRLVVDYWAAFARNGDPNPREGWLNARGYEGTLGEVRRVGRWEKVDANRPTMRVLQWGGRQVPLGEGHNEVCRGLGAPMDVLEA